MAGGKIEVEIEAKVVDLEKEKEKSGGSMESEESCGLGHYIGVLMALLNSFHLSIEMVLVTFLQRRGIDGQNCAFWGYFGITVFSIPFLLFYEFKSWRKKSECKGQVRMSAFSSIWPLTVEEKRQNFIGLMICGILAPSGAITRYIALGFIPLADTAVIAFSSPILVGILAHFFLQEKTGVIPIFSTILALIGVGIITKPPIFTGAQGFDDNILIGIAFAVGSMICGALQTIITRKIRNVEFSLNLLVNGLFGVGLGFGVSETLSGFRVPSDLSEGFMVLGLGLTSFLAILCLVLSLQMETAEVVSVVKTSNSVFAFLAQFAVLGMAPDKFSAIGSSLIFFGILITAFRKYLMTLPKDSKMKNSCFFLLY